MKFPKVSIIIPLYVIEDRFFKDLKKFDKLDYPDFEILVVCDKEVKLPKLKSNVRLILTGHERTGPAEKRDIAIQKAKGSICAFIDDDAYPDKKWLKNAVIHFSHPNIAVVGGPGLTPKEDGYWEQLTGLVYSSFFCGGHAQYRFIKGAMQFVDDYPAYNLLVRKDILEKVGGYGNHFYGGEDTFLCLKIIKEGYRLLYDPEVVVYHHRRPLFIPYLKQIANIGRHRGYFAKRFPETSRRFVYMFPTILAIGFIAGALLSLINIKLMVAFLLALGIFILLGILSVAKRASFFDSFLVSTGIITTHLSYGIHFVLGLLTKELKR